MKPPYEPVGGGPEEIANSERFLEAFSQIERFLKRKAPRQRHRSFYQLVELVSEMDSAVKQLELDIKEYADLRNAIIHERKGGQVIAEPNRFAVDDIERIAAIILAPPRAIPLFRAEVEELAEREPVAAAAALIHQRAISQIPIRRRSAVIGLLTSNTIARWLGACAAQSRPDLLNTPISDVLKHTEDKDSYAFLPRSATVFDILEQFQIYAHKGKRLDAILITEQGGYREKILGIVTVSDLAKAFQAVAHPAEALAGGRRDGNDRATGR